MRVREEVRVGLCLDFVKEMKDWAFAWEWAV